MHAFEWDGRDAFGRAVQGVRDADIRVGYVYDLTYLAPGEFVQAWGSSSGVPITGRRSGSDFILEQSWKLPLGQFSLQPMGFGGWMFSAQRIYDGRGKVFYDGDTTRVADPKHDSRTTVQTAAGNGECCDEGEGGLLRTRSCTFRT